MVTKEVVVDAFLTHKILISKKSRICPEHLLSSGLLRGTITRPFDGHLTHTTSDPRPDCPPSQSTQSQHSSSQPDWNSRNITRKYLKILQDDEVSFSLGHLESLDIIAQIAKE